MTLNILFLTVTIKKRSVNLEEIQRKEMIKKIYEENKDRQFSLQRPF